MKKSDQYLEMICPQCGKKFKPKHSKQFRCSFECSKLAQKESQQQKRKKICKECQKEFFDDSYKNSRYLCPKCEIKGFDEVVERLQKYRPTFQKYSEEILLQRLSEMRKNEKFFGRIGETLFLYLYPDSRDLNLEESDTSSYDFDHSILKRVDVKTCQPVERLGSKSWPFQKHAKKDCDYLFCIGFEKGRIEIAKIWLIPRKIFLSGSMVVCYDAQTVVEDHALLWLQPFEVTHLYDLNNLNLYLEKLFKVHPKWAYDLTKLQEMIPLWKGRLGELIFFKLYPQAKDMLIEKGIDSPYDFIEPFLGKIDVKTSAVDNNGCFNFKRKEIKTRELADNYFFVGLNRSYRKILALFLIPALDIRSLRGKLKLKPNESPYDVTSNYDLSKINVQALKQGIW